MVIHAGWGRGVVCAVGEVRQLWVGRGVAFGGVVLGVAERLGGGGERSEGARV